MCGGDYQRGTGVEGADLEAAGTRAFSIPAVPTPEAPETFG